MIKGIVDYKFIKLNMFEVRGFRGRGKMKLKHNNNIKE
jgi:hypothetical protein